MSRLFALGLLLLGSARADEAAGCSGCSDTDNGAGDSPFDDSCVDWYDANPGSCGGYDDSDFTSNEMCCACGGGNTTASVPCPTPVPSVPAPTPFPSDDQSQPCSDTSSHVYGAPSCDDYDYDSDPSSCGDYDAAFFFANVNCCACGGGDRCEDSTTWHMPNNDDKGCEWVGAASAAKTKKRCNKKVGADGEKAKSACPVTCGRCPGRNNQYGATE